MVPVVVNVPKNTLMFELSQRQGARGRGIVLIAQLLFSQLPKFSFPTFGLACLLPEFVRSRLDLLLARFGHYDCSRLEHGPVFQGLLGAIGRTVPDQLEDWPADSSPHDAASSFASEIEKVMARSMK